MLPITLDPGPLASRLQGVNFPGSWHPSASFLRGVNLRLARDARWRLQDDSIFVSAVVMWDVCAGWHVLVLWEKSRNVV